MESNSTAVSSSYPLISGLVLLLAFAICLAVVLLWILRNARRAARTRVHQNNPDQSKNSPAVLESPEDPAQTAAFDAGFRHNLNRLRQLVTGRSYRYDIPWALVVGTAGSGKTTLLNSVGLRRTFSTNYAPVIAAHLGVGWHFFNEGLAIDVPGAVFLGSGTTARHDRWWHRLLWQLRTARSQRPLDSVVLVLSVEDLRAQSAGPSRLALLIRDRLSELQKQIEMRVPVYLLITKCDLLHGFEAFSRELPEALRGQMCGWSNPHSIDLAFSSGWIDEAVFSMGDRIDRLAFEMFATDAVKADASAIFLLRNELGALQSGLREFASRLFAETPYGLSPLLRGIYLTGDPDGQPIPESIRPGSGSQAHPVFLDDLFARKIYAEKGVATPFPGAFLSKNRLTLALQTATIVFVIAAVVGTSHAYSRLNRTKQDQLVPLLSTLRYQGDPSSSFSVDTSFQVIRAMTDLQMDPFRSLFFPQSWSDSIDHSLGDAMVQSFLTVFEGLRTALDARHTQILAKVSATPPQCSNPGSREQRVENLPQYQQLSALVSDLNKWNNNVILFDRIVSPGYVNPDDLKQLVLYLNPSLLSQDVDFRNNPYFQRALNKANDRRYSRFDPVATTDSIKKLSTCFFNAWFGDNVLLTYTDEIERQIGNLQTGSMTFDDLGTLSQTIGAVSALMQQPDFQWAAKEHFDPADYVVFQNPVLQSRVVDAPELAKHINSTGDQAFQRFRSALGQTPSPSIEAVVEQASNQLVLSDQLIALSAFVGKVEQQPFAAHTPEGKTPARPLGQQIIWNVETLSAAIQLYRTYSTYSFGTLPTVFRRSVQDLVAIRTQANMLDLIASAQSFGSLGVESMRDNAVLLTAKNLAAVATPLAELLQDFNQPRFTAGRKSFASVVNEQAAQLLAALDASEKRLNPYEVRDSTLRWWNGETPLAPLAYQVSTAEDVKATVSSQTAALRELSQAAEPALTLLQVSNSLPAMPAHVSQVNWAGVVNDFKKLDEKKSNPISSLETFLVSGLDKVSPSTSCVDPSLSLPGDSTDLFVSIEEKIRNDLTARCRELAGSGYAQIAANFNEHLAGRFPFADPTGDMNGIEADPADIVKFFAIFDRYQAGATEFLKSAAAFGVLEAKQLAFLQQITAVRPLFANLFPGVAKGAPPSYDVQVQFRTNRTAEIQGDQVIDWEFDVAAQSLVPGSKVTTVSWHIGDPTRVSLRFAKNSPLRPVADSRSPGQVVGNRIVSFEYPDTWSLFRLVQLHKALTPSAVMTPGPCTLSFYIPTAPDPAFFQKGDPALGGQVRVYLQLSVTAAGSKDGLPFPAFPIEAPPNPAAPVTSASNR